MKGQYPLLNSLFARTEEDFVASLNALLVSRGLKNFTIWRITNGALCKPVSAVNGFTEGAFDIYDLGYKTQKMTYDNQDISYFEDSLKNYATYFLAGSESFNFALSFHERPSEDMIRWLEALTPYLAVHADEIISAGRRMDIFIDYQKKIDFIKNSAQILKILSVEEVTVNALNFFSEMFHAQAYCAVRGGFFEGFGITYKDLRQEIFYRGSPISSFLEGITGTIYIEQDLSSNRFEVANLFLIYEPLSSSYFLLFNITADAPDRELSELITHIVSIAVENARHHEIMTRFKVEEAEMSQTIEILNQFVMREQQICNLPQVYSVNYPAKSTGGDFTTIIDNDDFTFACVADVCGKGYAAAVFTVMLATMMESGLYTEFSDLKKLSNGLNKYLLNRDFNQRFITAFFCYYDKASQILSYISCGHEPTVYITSEGIKTLVSQNIPIGIVNEMYEVQQIKVEPGSFIFIYTDGLTEYITTEGLLKKLDNKKEMPLKDLVESLYKELVEDPAEQRDDFTCVAMKF